MRLQIPCSLLESDLHGGSFLFKRGLSFLFLLKGKFLHSNLEQLLSLYDFILLCFNLFLQCFDHCPPLLDSLLFFSKHVFFDFKPFFPLNDFGLLALDVGDELFVLKVPVNHAYLRVSHEVLHVRSLALVYADHRLDDFE